MQTINKLNEVNKNVRFSVLMVFLCCIVCPLSFTTRRSRTWRILHNPVCCDIETSMRNWNSLI